MEIRDISGAFREAAVLREAAPGALPLPTDSFQKSATGGTGLIPPPAGSGLATAADYMPGEEAQGPPVDTAALIQKVRSGEIKSDRDLNDPLSALNRPNTCKVVDEMRDSNAPLAPGAERTFGHARTNGQLFTDAGNWADLGTAVAADQLAAMPEAQRAEFARLTGAPPAEITPGEASLMLVPPTKDFDKMVAPRPEMKYNEIDYSKLGHVTIDPKAIVIHYTAAVKDTPESVRAYFNQCKGVPSVQFIVGKDGHILQIMPETQKCRGTLDFNDATLQVEVCGNFREEKETDAEVNSTVALVKYFQKQYHIPDTQIISHRQVDNNFHHVGRKPDPTFHFMNRLYEAVK